MELRWLRREESSPRAKSFSAMSAADPNVDKFSPEKDAGVFNLLKTNFLSSPSTCAQLVVEDVADQTGGAAESVADQADAEKTANQGSPVGVSE
ncbi:unnamed protein product [Prunus armeniaca]